MSEMTKATGLRPQVAPTRDASVAVRPIDAGAMTVAGGLWTTPKV